MNSSSSDITVADITNSNPTASSDVTMKFCLSCKDMIPPSNNNIWYYEEGYCISCGIKELGLKIGTIELII